jgi:hypothetical protein
MARDSHEKDVLNSMADNRHVEGGYQPRAPD